MPANTTQTEKTAVNAVEGLLLKCLRLNPEILSSDKIPFTDGHVDVYASEDKTNANAIGRVPVQVKGRVLS